MPVKFLAKRLAKVSQVWRKNYPKKQSKLTKKTFWRAPTVKGEASSRQTSRQSLFLAEKK